MSRMTRLAQNYWKPTREFGPGDFDPPDIEEPMIFSATINLSDYRKSLKISDFGKKVRNWVGGFKGWDTSHPDFAEAVQLILAEHMAPFSLTGSDYEFDDSDGFWFDGRFKIGRRGLYMDPDKKYDIIVKAQGRGKLEVEMEIESTRVNDGDIKKFPVEGELNLDLLFLENGKKFYHWKDTVHIEFRSPEFDVDGFRRFIEYDPY